MTQTSKTPPPLPPAGGSYALVDGVWVKIPEDDQQVHAKQPANRKGKE